MPSPLNIRADRNPPKRRDLASNIDPDNPNMLAHVDQEFGMMVRSPVAGMIRVVYTEQPSSLEQHLAADAVETVPFALRRRCDEFVTAEH